MYAKLTEPKLLANIAVAVSSLGTVGELIDHSKLLLSLGPPVDSDYVAGRKR